MKIERIRWSDHHLSADAGWWTEEEIHEAGLEPWLMESVGFVAYEDEATVLLTQTYQSDPPRHQHYQAIKKALILDRKVLEDEAD